LQKELEKRVNEITKSLQSEYQDKINNLDREKDNLKFEIENNFKKLFDEKEKAIKDK